MNTTLTPEHVEELRRRLLARQRALFAEVDDIEADLELIEETRESELEGRAQQEAMARLLDRVQERDRRELEEIQRALAKIPAGAYGWCESCRDPIPLARLQAIPEARRCRDCEEVAERAALAAAKPFAPRAHRPMPGEYADLDDAELAEVVRERIRAHGDPDLLEIEIRCHGGVVRLAGEIPSDRQRQILLQIVGDGLGLEVLDRLRVRGLAPELDEAASSAGEAAEAIEERIPAGQGMRPLPEDRWAVPEDEGEPPETAPDEPLPEKE